jgi:hypothetical protein
LSNFTIVNEYVNKTAVFAGSAAIDFVNKAWKSCSKPQQSKGNIADRTNGGLGGI